MAHKKTDTVRDLLRADLLLEVTCAACRRLSRFAPSDLAGMYGMETRTARLRWRCTACGGTAVVLSSAKREEVFPRRPPPTPPRPLGG